MSLFAAVELAPRDPILGLNEQFNADPNPAKVNLGVGVYFDDNGKLPLLALRAGGREAADGSRPSRAATCRSTASPPTTRPCRAWCSAPTAPPSSDGRVATVQALGGTGGLKVGADFLKRLNPDAKVLISDPSWENHRALFTQRRLRGRRPTRTTTPPRAASTSTRMLAALSAAPAGTHRRAARLLPQPDRLRHRRRRSGRRWWPSCKARGLVPFLDMAYQGFGDGIAEDGAAVAASSSPPASTSSSRPRSRRASRCTASASARSAWSATARTRRRACCAQLKIVIRTNYSNPPTHGAQVVATVLTTPALRAMWEEELAGMRVRIKADARARWSASCRPPASTQDFELHHAPAGHVQLLRA